MKRKELTFRVFISSTFSDFMAERRALQDVVFPRLRTFCEQRNARFQPVDYRKPRKRFSVPIGLDSRLCLLRNGIAIVRSMDTSFVEIAFFSPDGEMQGRWNNRNLRNGMCSSFYAARSSVRGTLLVLLRAEAHQSSMQLRRIELDESGQVLSDQMTTCDVSPMSKFMMARDTIIVWDREHLHLINMESCTCTPLNGWDSRIGDICRVELAPLMDGRDRLNIYGTYGIQIVGIPTLEPMCLLPGNGLNDRIVILDNGHLCRVRSMIHHELFTIT